MIPFPFFVGSRSTAPRGVAGFDEDSPFLRAAVVKSEPEVTVSKYDRSRMIYGLALFRRATQSLRTGQRLSRIHGSDFLRR